MPYEYPPDEPTSTWSDADAMSRANPTAFSVIAGCAIIVSVPVGLAICIAVFPIACAYVAAALYVGWIAVTAGRAFSCEIRTSRSLWSASGGALDAACETAFFPILAVFTPAVMGPLLFLWMLIAATRWVIQ